MAANNFFQNISDVFDANLLQSVNGVINNGLAWAQPQIRAATVLFILITGWLILTGRMDKNVLASRVLRIMAVGALLGSPGLFNTYVRDLFLNELPASIGGALTGGPTYAPAAQFDALWNATQRIAATMLAEATGYTQFGERIVIRLLLAVSFVALVIIFLMWVIVRVIMGMVIALGPFLIGLFLFDATRPYVERWVGKLVSLTLVQVCISVMLQMLMGGFNNYVRVAQTNPGGSLDEKIGAFLQVGAWYWCGLFLIASLSIVAYSIGGGLATSFAPLTHSAAGMPGSAASGIARSGVALRRGAVGGYHRLRGGSASKQPAE